MRPQILNREQAPQRCFTGLPLNRKQPPSLEELERELEVLRNKLRSLELSHMRIEREAQRLMGELQAVRNTIISKPPTASDQSCKAIDIRQFPSEPLPSATRKQGKRLTSNGPSVVF